jgi:hypothetical protein
MLPEQSHALARRCERGFHAARIGHGLEPDDPPGAHWREREAGQRLDDTIELERPEGTGVHEENGDQESEPIGPGQGR